MAALARIASLLPGATESCFALGLGDRLVGVSHECDHPAQARELPVLTRASVDSTAAAGEIDRQVRERSLAGLSLYDIDLEALRRASPELVITQDTCDVCAVSLSDVERAVADALGKPAAILSLSPRGLEDVLDDLSRIGASAGVERAAAELAANLRGRLERLRALTAPLARPRVLALEWTDPPMVAGHWTPELLRAAGAEPVLGHEQAPTRATTWDQIAASDPDVVVIAPCGFSIEQSRRELPALRKEPGFSKLRAVQEGRVFLIDGHHYFNRPGPRLIDSAEIAAAALHPELAGELDPPAAAIARAP